MKSLEAKDYLVLNNIIYRIYATENFDKMRKEFLEQMKLVLDFDSADFYLAGTKGDGLTRPVAYNCIVDRDIWEGVEDYRRALWHGGKTMVYRETDMLPDEEREATEIYRKLYLPNNWHYSLQMVLAWNQRFTAVVTFYRNVGREDFQYDDIFIADMLKEHLSLRIWQEMCRGSFSDGRMSVETAADRFALTRREESILRYLVSGADNSRTCEELSISMNTLKKHMVNIYRKMGVNSRIALFKMVRDV